MLTPLKHIFFVFLFFVITLNCFSQTEFITTWKTTTAGESITIPTDSGGYTYNYNVDWGDGSIDTTNYTGNATHTYATAGTYTVTITGTFNKILFDNSADSDKILSIEQWGTNQVWINMVRAFDGCANLVNNATDVPDLSSCGSTLRMFADATSIGTGSATNWNSWDLSNVTNVAQMFRNCPSFNKNISNWNVSNVTVFNNLFNGATSFNQNIGGWTTTAALSMNAVFKDATAFNQNISSWDVSSVTTMNSLFNGASLFNQDISGWTTTSLNSMNATFRNASAFNQDITGWDVSGVTNMDNLFNGASSFNQDISGWTTTSLNSMIGTFANTTAFNQDISGWDVSGVTTMNNLFKNTTAFNQDIGGWTTTALLSLDETFRNATAFDQDISGWDVSGVTSMNDIFNGAELSLQNYNALLIGWNAQSLQPNIAFHGGTSKYCSTAAIAAKANMIASDTWTFTDGGVLATFVWDGSTDSDWSDATNWQDGFDTNCVIDISIPTTSNDPIINSATTSTVNDVTINSGASLTINGALTVEGNLTTNNALTLNSGSSIIVNGTSSGNLTYNRNLPNGNEYYNTASPVIGETIENFISNNSLNTGNGNVGLYYYDNNATSGYAGTGYVFYQPTSTGSMENAKGYGVQLSSGSDIAFTGTMPTADASISIGTGSIDNSVLVGNPYPSYLPVNQNAVASNNILTENTGVLSEETAWFWDNTINNYVAVNNGSPARYLAPGQGFFVDAGSSGSFSFLESWQEHQATDVFNKTTDDTFRVYLSLENSLSQKKATEIYFIPNKTIYFDNGYDSSSLSDENAALSLATKLVGDANSQNLAIQTLPTENINNSIIPLSVNGQNNLTFSIDYTNKPNDIKFYLEDKLLNTFTLLDINSSYTVNNEGQTTGTGRFYLHTKSKVLHTEENTFSAIKIYVSKNKNLILEGIDNKTVELKIVDILGKERFYKKQNFSNQEKSVSLKTLSAGIYFVQLKTQNQILNQKVLLE